LTLRPLEKRNYLRAALVICGWLVLLGLTVLLRHG